jgi:hypothetical protein
MSSPISSFYRFWFFLIDPILALSGVYILFWTPDFFLSGVNPAYSPPTSSETLVLLDTGAAWLIAATILEQGLLRARPNDVVVWKYFAASICVVDTLVCAATLRALESQGRLGIEDWRWEEWVNLGSTGACAVVRLALVLGVGVADGASGGKKRA